MAEFIICLAILFSFTGVYYRDMKYIIYTIKIVACAVLIVVAGFLFGATLSGWDVLADIGTDDCGKTKKIEVQDTNVFERQLKIEKNVCFIEWENSSGNTVYIKAAKDTRSLPPGYVYRTKGFNKKDAQLVVVAADESKIFDVKFVGEGEVENKEKKNVAKSTISTKQSSLIEEYVINILPSSNYEG